MKGKGHVPFIVGTVDAPPKPSKEHVLEVLLATEEYDEVEAAEVLPMLRYLFWVLGKED